VRDKPDLRRLGQGFGISQATARTRGYAVERQEFEDGIGFVSAPYFDLAGTVAGSLTVAMPVARLDTDEASIARTVTFHAAAASHPAARPGPQP
jgi:DNA-binding IclR family transcriptional regulator